MNNFIEQRFIEDILKQFDNKIEGNNEINQFIRRALDSAKSKLLTLPRLRDMKKYRLVFIGKQGCGKTTCIANLTGLLSEELFSDALNEDNTIDLQDASLLTVGTGGTTAPEVYIKQLGNTEQSHIIVKCCSMNKLIQYVSTYVSKQCKDIKKDENDDYGNLSREHERIIEGLCLNQIKKNESQLEEKHKGEKKRFSWLPLIIQDIINDELNNTTTNDELIKNVSKIIIEKYMLLNYCEELNEEKEIKIMFNNDDKKEFRQWLKNTFHDINIGTYPGILIPKEVHIFISVLDLDMKLSCQDYDFSEIVDTRGYRQVERDKDGKVKFSGDGDRADIKAYLKYNKNDDSDFRNICLMTDRYINFTEGHSNVINEIILNYMSLNDSNQVGLNSILVNWKKGEPKGQIDANKRKNDNEMITYRIEEIQEFFEKNKGYIFNKDNVFEYNPTFAYKIINDSEVEHYTIDKAEKAREELKNKLVEMINKEKERLNSEINTSYRCIKNFIDNDKFELGNNSDAIIEELSNNVLNVANNLGKEFDNLSFENGYKSKLESFGSRSYKPLALKEGIHKRTDGTIDSIYDITREVVNDEYKEKINLAGRLILDKIDESIDICSSAIDGQNLSDSLMLLKKNVEDIFGYMEDELINNMLQEVQNTFSKANSFWDKVKDIAKEGGTGVNSKIKNVFVLQLGECSPLEKTTFRTRTNKIVSDIINKCKNDLNEIFK